MKFWLIYVLFNVATGQLSPDAIWVKTVDTLDACNSAAVNEGVQKPDKDGNLKIYLCQVSEPDNEI